MESNRELEELKHKVENLEYKEINSLKDKVGNIEVNLAKNNILTEQAIENASKLSDTMTVVKETMIQMAESMKVSNRVSEELAENVKTLSNQVVVLDDKVDNKFKEFDDRIEIIDEKSKFDILTWVKNNFVGCLLGIGAIVYFISQYIK